MTGFDENYRRLENSRQPDCAAIFSGGLDSTTLVYNILARGLTPHLISFDYGQRHRKELEYAKHTATKLGLKHDIIDLTGITHLISNSALTTTYGKKDGIDDAEIVPTIEVPEGHYAEDNMKKTVVPNRNMIMLSIAAGIAVNNSYMHLFTGVHAGDHFVYPDCRPEFIQIVNAAVMYGNKGFGPFDDEGRIINAPMDSFIFAPYVNSSKADIAYSALELNVPIADTWSCYKGDDIHCGKCGTCVERLEAIHEAAKKWNKKHNLGVHDLEYKAFDETEYADKDFWRQAVASK